MGSSPTTTTSNSRISFNRSRSNSSSNSTAAVARAAAVALALEVLHRSRRQESYRSSRRSSCGLMRHRLVDHSTRLITTPNTAHTASYIYWDIVHANGFTPLATLLWITT